MAITELEVPQRLRGRPRDKHGRVVPWFAALVNGQYDFRVIRPDGINEAHLNGTCWVCGVRLGAFRAFVIGPMCVVNRVSAEPPSHRECAIYSAQVCPFLTTPNMVRRESGLAELKTSELPGEMIRRNPGVTVVWVVKRYKRFSVPGEGGKPGGHLFDIGDPHEILWFAEGREATRSEIEASIQSGLPALQASADADGEQASKHLARQVEEAMRLLPVA